VRGRFFVRGDGAVDHLDEGRRLGFVDARGFVLLGEQFVKRFVEAYVAQLARIFQAYGGDAAGLQVTGAQLRCARVILQLG